MGSANAYLTKCQRPESIVHEHMADREDRVPSVTLDLDDMILRYDAYHSSQYRLQLRGTRAARTSPDADRR